MAIFVERHLSANGVTLRLGRGVEAFRARSGGGLTVVLSSGEQIDADLVILAIGVRPDTSLANETGLVLGELGGIRVDDSMRTNDPHIWAVGDVVEVRNVVTGGWQLAALAGPANRQGRIAAASILRALYHDETAAAVPVRFRGVQNTAVCGVFGLTVATTGASEKMLRRSSIEGYAKVYLHPGSHASYFPGAQPIHLKLLCSKDKGRILGAQAIGEVDVARRIDVIAMAMQMGASVYDLEEAELCYAPQFGAAKDPVNLAGMIAANHLRGDLPLARWEEILEPQALILDVRSRAEFAKEHIAGAVNIPLEELRGRLSELPRDQAIWLVCGVGQRAYYATCALLQRGFKVANLPGGMQTYATFAAREPPASGE